MPVWNPWHGCKKISPGCQNCYVYRTDIKHGKDSMQITKNKTFDLPLKKDRSGEYKLKPTDGDTIIYTCFTSDFFINEADKWREEIWNIMNIRRDLKFLFITKRIDRFYECIPSNWGDGYNNVTICCTVENQDRVDYRLPIFLELPIKHKHIVCEPLLEEINITKYLTKNILSVIAGGESGTTARMCDFDWIISLQRQCIQNNVSFKFKQTGANFIKNGRHFKIDRKFQHSQAKKANINFTANNNIIVDENIF